MNARNTLASRDLSRFAASFAAVLRQHRKLRRLSQEALAHRAGLHRTYVGLIERGERRCTVITAKKLASALGLSLAQLVAEAEARACSETSEELP